MKKVLCLVLAMLMLLSAVAAFAEEVVYPAPKVKTDGKLQVGFLVQNLESEYNRRCHQAIQVEAAHRGWDLTSCVVNSNEERVSALNTLINKEVDAIIISNMDMPAMASYIGQARQNGIGVYNCDTEVVPG
ncbi:MAG: substrate-binding domain-containing protein, partial [Clostridia bacterium]